MISRSVMFTPNSSQMAMNSATEIEAGYLNGGFGVMKVFHKNSFLTKIDQSKVLKEPSWAKGRVKDVSATPAHYS